MQTVSTIWDLKNCRCSENDKRESWKCTNRCHLSERSVKHFPFYGCVRLKWVRSLSHRIDCIEWAYQSVTNFIFASQIEMINCRAINCCLFLPEADDWQSAITPQSMLSTLPSSSSPVAWQSNNLCSSMFWHMKCRLSSQRAHLFGMCCFVMLQYVWVCVFRSHTSTKIGECVCASYASKIPISVFNRLTYVKIKNLYDFS